ncbi:MAG: hypothetical protein ACOZAA_02175, partial [Pseudomonadota bacterium]
AGRTPGFVIISLSPILTDGSRLVGKAWPAALVAQNCWRRQQNFCVAAKCSLEHFVLRVSTLRAARH